MRRALVVSLRMAVVTIVLTGFIYPLAVWGVSSVVFPKQAAGSLITRADGYDAMSSGASNLGPTSKALFTAVERRVAETQRSDGAARGAIPVDAVTTSGSGLDPDITPDNAAIQIARVAKARGVPQSQVRELVAAQTTSRQLGLLGEPRVNVLELNLALDALSSR
jgi:K+-transporting ATPase ATPase C chain